jgi:DNA-directed RNA polymerase sigma subunit (sigma70/sigma32)
MQAGQSWFVSTASTRVHGPCPPADRSGAVERTVRAAWRVRNQLAPPAPMIRRHPEEVVETAAAHSGCGLPWDELIAEAHVGLMRAACRFDPDSGVSFAVYARWWVETAVQDLILRGARPRSGQIRIVPA